MTGPEQPKEQPAETGTNHTATIIWIHGLGDTAAGDNTQNLKAKVLSTPELSHVKFLTPQAPQRVVTCDGGIEEPAWFDMPVCPINAASPVSEDADVAAAAARIHALIDAEVAAGTPSTRILLGGFSQGAATTLAAATTFPAPLAGAAVLWGWVPVKPEVLAARAAEGAKGTPLLWSHSRSDLVITFDCAEAGVDMLRGLGFAVELQAYEGPDHHPHPEETADVVRWLTSRLAP